jgi:hypothetical protein
MKKLFSGCYCLLALLIVLHSHAGVMAQTAAKKKSVQKKTEKKEDLYAMLNGIWRIESSSPKEVAQVPKEFLPPDTRLELMIEGPTEAALDAGQSNELEGKFILLPPFPQGICNSGLGVGNGYGSDVCENGKVIDPNDSVSNYAEFIFERWEHKTDIEQLRNNFFVKQGAKLGAQFLIISLRYRGIAWKLWIRDRDTLIGEYTAVLPSKELVGVTQIWRRVKTP